LATDAETGIIGDVKDINRRKKFFGKNKRSLPSTRSFWAILWDQFDEFYMQVLLLLGAACLVLCFFSDSVTWVDAVSILFAVLFAGLIQTFCDWGKEKQFLLLQEEIKNDKVNVLRGHMGTSQTIFCKDVVVGDVVLLGEGDRVPADCMLIAEMDMKVDQKQFFPDMLGSEMAPKQCSYGNEENDIEKNPDNILLQDSIVMSGSGKAVVLAVGKHTLKEKEIKEELGSDKNALQIEKTQTPFQKKLETLAEIIGTYAKMVCIASVFLFAIVWILHVMIGEGRKLVDDESIKQAIDLACTVAALLAVCIPEGMPLVISMAMAFSVQSLKKENLLIKNLDGLETSGQLVDVVTGKTATLTEGEMQVEVVHSQGTTYDARSLEMTKNVENDLKQAIVLNSDAHMQMDKTDYMPKGSPVEVGLLQFVSDLGVAVHDKFLERENEAKYELKAWIPFSSDRKVMTVAYINKQQDENQVLVVQKGAPEAVLGNCTSFIDQTGDSQEGIDVEGTMSAIEQEVILHKGDTQEPMGLKAITFATKIMDASDIGYDMDFEDESNRSLLESGLTYVATLGLSDPLRENVEESIEKLNNTKTNVRILSGDHKLAVMSTALALGMKEDMHDEEDVMEGSVLLELLKQNMELQEDTEEGRGATWVFKNSEAKSWFKKQIKKRVCFVYRANPELKHVFVAALRNSDSIVGVTGEGLGDARALSEASVGFAMGKDGCDAAKDHCDIIMMDDQFDTLVSAIRFGRNVQDNVRKFVQFQLTVNLTTMLFVISTVLILGHSPFNVVQLLWINLVMDVLAAIAFSTECPHPDQISQDRVTAKDRIITKPMMRQILFQSLYQLIVMLLVLYVGPTVGDYSYSLFTTPMSANGLDTYRCLHQTFMFHCFIMMNLFNMVNCRLIDPIPQPEPEAGEVTPEELEEIRRANKPSFNIFQRPFANFWFWIVFFAELNVQFFMIGYKAIGNFFNTTPLSFSMHMTALGLALGSWAVCALIKLTGPKLIAAMPEFGEDAEALERAKSISDRAGQVVSVSQVDQEPKGVESDDDGYQAPSDGEEYPAPAGTPGDDDYGVQR